MWQMQVTQPHNIEVPRSLVEIVVSWNVPMHAWLKKYVFKQARKSFGLYHYLHSTLYLLGLGKISGRWILSGRIVTFAGYTVSGHFAGLYGRISDNFERKFRIYYFR